MPRHRGKYQTKSLESRERMYLSKEQGLRQLTVLHHINAIILRRSYHSYKIGWLSLKVLLRLNSPVSVVN